MSSSGLIYAVIVGAWAAYLVPMWLRRQDELNEARPTERFSTAIRLLSGRAAMERRYARAHNHGSPAERDAAENAASGSAPPSPAAAVDVRALAIPVEEPPGHVAKRKPAAKPQPAGTAHPSLAAALPRKRSALPLLTPSPATAPARSFAPPQKRPRAKLLARRRRTTSVLFLAFTIGSIGAAVGGAAFLWAPAIPGALLTAYIVYLRRQERRRFEARLAARRRPPAAGQRAALPAAARRDTPAKKSPTAPPDAEDDAAASDRAAERRDADRRAVVQETDHAEWVDGLHRRDLDPEGWEPVPVPLPTYVTAPVAPRSTPSIDLAGPDTWSSARSSTADPAPEQQRPAPGRRARDRGRTPLFDQYAEDEDRPRAANE